MKPAILFLGATVIASLGVAVLFIGPWFAWKFMGVHDLICYGLFCGEIALGGAVIAYILGGPNAR